jgi:Tfp pilus assembly protein PilF
MIQALLLLALSQPSPQKLYLDGTAAFEAGDYARAESLYALALKGKPAEIEYLRAYGASLGAQGKFDAALQPLETACRQSAPSLPNRGLACYQWGRTLFHLRRYEDSLRAFDFAKESAPPTAQMYSARAQALDALGRAKEADADFRQALAESALRTPESAGIQLLYGNFLARQGLHDAAIWQFEQAIRKTPFNERLWEEKAKSLLALGQERLAVEALERALSHGVRKRETVLLLARVYQHLGQPEKAKAYLEEAGSKLP